jgi:aminoglycoside/choline kinase family phosphotransferase
VDLVRERYPGARVLPIAGDASTRRFHRVLPEHGGSVVLMDYGEPFRGTTDDIRLAAVFHDAGLPVPRILESSPGAGCLVLEDLGERTFQYALESGMGGEDLYPEAVDLAVAIADRGTASLERSERAAGPALDEERFRFEMDFFLEHSAGRFVEVGGDPERLRGPLYELAAEAARSPRKVLCHRDYHSRNLMVREDGSLAMVDFQDARWGPDSYDLASLMRDAYAEIDESLVERMIDRYIGALPWTVDPVRFRTRFDTVALQRMIKALGTFGYQAGKLGRRRYLEGVPRTLARIVATIDRLPRFESLRVTGVKS